MTSGDATDGCLSDPEEIITKLHVNRGHAPAQQLKRVSMGSDWGNMRLVNYVAKVPEQWFARRALVKAPHMPIAGTATV